MALAASADGVTRPLAARTRGRPVVLFQGGIHAGEIDGKDAGILVLRELLAAAGRTTASDPTARGEHVHRLHPSWDDAFRLYPVLRSAARP